MDVGGRRCFRVAGQIYYGDVLEDAEGRCTRHGQGVQIFTATTVTGEALVWGKYTGGWKKDRMTGSGSYRWSDGSAYEGGMLDGKLHGHGRFTWPEGSWYDGVWCQSEMHGQGSFFNAYDGYPIHGQIVRNCIQMPDGCWVNLANRRAQRRAERLRIGAPPPLPKAVALADEHGLVPVAFCRSPQDLGEIAAAVLRGSGSKVPLILADFSCPPAGGSYGSAAPLWCLELGDNGCNPSTTVHMERAVIEKRRKRDHASLFIDAIRESLLTYKPFCLVFGEEEEEGKLPMTHSLDNFFDPLSLPSDLFDLPHLHAHGALRRFLHPEKRDLLAAEVSETETAGESAPPTSPPPVLHLLRFAIVSQRRIPCGVSEDDIRAHVAHRFADHIPIHRVSVLVVSGEN
mmetsp:Transcript_67875/g.196432  ORF Transcript_67875/g.196432 Transcript_67875/m.196432 type:complete len:400 (-) Transcript_67875:53-1252(-)